MKEIDSDPDLKLQLAVTGAHLSPEFGKTLTVIEDDGFTGDARKSLVAFQPAKKGEPFTEDNLGIKRPRGVSPMQNWNWLGRTAERDFNPDETVE